MDNCVACGSPYAATSISGGLCGKCRAEGFTPDSFAGFPMMRKVEGNSVSLTADHLKMLDDLPAFTIQKISGTTYHKDLKRGDAKNDSIPEAVVAQLKARKGVYRARVSKEPYQYGLSYGEAICAAYQAHKTKGKESNEALPNPAPSQD